MKEEWVYKLSIFFAIIGIGLVYASSAMFEYPSKSIGGIEEDMMGERVKVDGTVTSYYQSGTNSFITLEDKGRKMQVVEFDRDFDITEGDRITVKGKIDMYEGNLQVVAEEIEKTG